jgi:hypothetical protein
MATRFYLPSSGDAAVSPAFDAGWEDTHEGQRYKLVTTKISSAMATHVFTDSDYSDRDCLFHQYVSDPIAAQTISAQTVKIQFRCYEDSALHDLYLSIGIRVVSNDGATVRGTILAVTRDATEAVVSTLTNRKITPTSTEVVAQSGDRIVIEIGMGGDPQQFGAMNHGSGISFGDDSATDLGENDTDTSAYNPWVEFANTISFSNIKTVLGLTRTSVKTIDGLVLASIKSVQQLG